MRDEPVLTLEDVRIAFPASPDPLSAVRGVSLTLARGEILGLVGESGSGKSVTARGILRLDERGGAKASGRIHLTGTGNVLDRTEKEMCALRGDRIAMVLQDPMTSLNPAYRVGDQVAEIYRVHRGMGRRQARAAAVDMLASVGLSDPERQARLYPHEFSGGMRQRAVMAMALACEPDVLIADEPTTALDVTVQARILDLLRDLRTRTGTSILFITHDLGVVATLCDRVAVMYGGRIVEEAPVASLFDGPRHPYTRALLASLPVPGMTGDLRPVPGEPPDLNNLPPGCPFAPRCPLAAGECEVMPPFVERGRPDHQSACWMEEDDHV